MKNYFVYTCIALCILAGVWGCDHRLTHNSDLNMIEFDKTPVLIGYVVADQAITDQKVVVNYRNGMGKSLTIGVEPQDGLLGTPVTVTLAQGAGSVDIPLSGTAKTVGAMTLVIKGRYDFSTISNELLIGVRPDPLPDANIVAGPELEGFLFDDVETSAAVNLSYTEGWGRKVTTWFSCVENGSLNTGPVIHSLAVDESLGELSLPLGVKPQGPGAVTLVFHMQFEGAAEQTYNFPTEVSPFIPYVKESVSHTIIVSDLPDLLAAGNTAMLQMQTQTFTYETVFLDINGDGYVTNNLEIWLDRNIGATSNNPDDEDSYGLTYMIGRDAPGFVNNGMNLGFFYNGERYRWTTANYPHGLWYNAGTSDLIFNEFDSSNALIGTITVAPGELGPNNPCPAGFRPPTIQEWITFNQYMIDNKPGYSNTGPTNIVALKDAPLHIPLAGGYQGNAATTAWTGKGTDAAYWALPSVINGQTHMAVFHNNSQNGFGNGFSATRPAAWSVPIRCIRANLENYPVAEP